MKKNARKLELNRIVRIAAIKLDPNGKANLERIATQSGISYDGLMKALRVGRFTAGMASALELGCGKHLLTKEQLCPETYKA